MRRLIIGVILILTVVIAAGGCGSSKEVNIPMRFESIKKGPYGFAFVSEKTPQTFVFHTADEWQKFWDTSAKRSINEEGGLVPFADPDPYSDELEPIRPDIRFARQFVVGVVFEKPTGVYDVQVDKIIRTNDKIIVKVDLRREFERDPKTGQILKDPKTGELIKKETGAFETTAPYQFVKVDGNFDLPVEFKLNAPIESKKTM